MKKTLFALVAGLLLALPVACMHHHGGPGGPGGPNCPKHQGCDCKCRQQPDCPKKADCPKGADCPKTKECPQHQQEAPPAAK